jgi:hypothetical protein
MCDGEKENGAVCGTVAPRSSCRRACLDAADSEERDAGTVTVRRAKLPVAWFLSRRIDELVRTMFAYVT